MPQESGPLQGTNFTDAQWRAIFGGEPGIVGDVNGSSYSLTLPSGSNDAVLGSSTQDSTSVVAGYMHRIPQGQTQSVTIPPSTNTVGRTDIIVVRFDAGSYTSAPGPCRLYRVPGVEGSSARPSLDESPPGVEDFPLWAVTRKGNGTTAEGLNQAARVDLRRRTGPSLSVPPGEVLPDNVPLGTRASRAGTVYRRDFNSSGNPDWVVEAWADVDWTNAPQAGGALPADTPVQYKVRSGVATLTGGSVLAQLQSGLQPVWGGSYVNPCAPLPAPVRPSVTVQGTALSGTKQFDYTVKPTGAVTLIDAGLGGTSASWVSLRALSWPVG